MNNVPVRELRNHTAQVVDRARSGEPVTITVNGVPAATLEAVGPPVKAFFTKAELLAMRPTRPDPDLAADIAALADETTDELGPIQ